jgi:hypothetical protein
LTGPLPRVSTKGLHAGIHGRVMLLHTITTHGFWLR